MCPQKKKTEGLRNRAPVNAPFTEKQQYWSRDLVKGCLISALESLLMISGKEMTWVGLN